MKIVSILAEVNDILKLIFGELSIVNHTDYFKYNFMYLFCKWIRRGHHVQVRKNSQILFDSK